MGTLDTTLTFRQTESDIYRLNQWIYKTIQPYVKGTLLEVGSGRGQMADNFLQQDNPLHLTDANEVNSNFLKNKFANSSVVKTIQKIDFNSETFFKQYHALAGTFDTIAAINITEQGLYEKATLNNAKQLLRPRGHFITILPSRAALYYETNQELTDLAYYNFKAAKQSLGSDFEILKVRCFNWVATLDIEPDFKFGLLILVISRKIPDS